MRKLRTSKATMERLHAKKRLAERYGLELNKQQYQDLSGTIRNGKAKLIRRQSLRVTLWEVPFQGKTIFCVYDKKRHQVVTVLKPEWVKP